MKFLLISALLFSSTVFASVERKDVKTLLEKEFGVVARPYSTQNFGRDKFVDAISIIIPESNYKTTLFQFRKKLPKGLIAYIGTTRNLSEVHPKGVELVVLISNDKFDILRVSKSDGINYDITNEKVIEKLQHWDNKYSIDIWQAETDTVQLTVQKLPKSLEVFANEVYEFCPDIVGQGSGNISDISDYLKAEKAIYLWWD
jgi:hypothetical protein